MKYQRVLNFLVFLINFLNFLQAVIIYFELTRHVRLRAQSVCTVSLGNIRFYWDVELTHEFDSFVPACKFSTGHPETCDLVVRVIVVVISVEAIITTKGASACMSSEELLVFLYHYYWKVFIDISGVEAARIAILSVHHRMQTVSDRLTLHH